MRTREIVNEINSLLNQSTYLYAQYAQENRISYVEMMVLYALLNTDAPLTQIELGAYYVISKQSKNSAVKNTKQKKNKGKYKNKCQNIWWNKIKAVPLQSLLKSKGGYQSGQMGQTVNLLAMPSVVRIHHHPLFPNITRDKRVRISYEIWIFFVYTSLIPNQH